MQRKHTIFVCQSCAGVWKDGRQVGNSGGYLLHQELAAQAQDWPLAAEFQIQGVSCLGSCNRSCSIALAAVGKSTYLFGDLQQSESVTEISQAILECASLYHSKPDGSMTWSERPEKLKKGLVGRIPSLETPVNA